MRCKPLNRTIYPSIPRLDNKYKDPLEQLNMPKKTSLAVICLLLVISTAAQTLKQHFNLGMTIDDFATEFELARMDTRDERRTFDHPDNHWRKEDGVSFRQLHAA